MKFKAQLLLFLILTLVHSWIPCNYKATAVRLFPDRSSQKMVEEEKQSHHERMFFSGRSYNYTQRDLDDSKRRVPSCPDPLHNSTNLEMTPKRSRVVHSFPSAEVEGVLAATWRTRVVC